VDTAGLRETDDAIEAEGVRRTRELVGRADIILRLYEGEAIAQSEHPSEITVRTKCDLHPFGHSQGIAVSSKTAEGLAELKRALADRLAGLAGEKQDEVAASPDGLIAALSLLPPAEAFSDGADLVLIGNSLRLLADRLGELVGATYSEDLLTNLFSRFCVGK
jgi:tRNA modification GTPase